MIVRLRNHNGLLFKNFTEEQIIVPVLSYIQRLQYTVGRVTRSCKCTNAQDSLIDQSIMAYRSATQIILKLNTGIFTKETTADNVALLLTNKQIMKLIVHAKMQSTIN
jgi:hypothetical protein